MARTPTTVAFQVHEIPADVLDGIRTSGVDVSCGYPPTRPWY
jgi:hypothetical protein